MSELKRLIVTRKADGVVVVDVTKAFEFGTENSITNVMPLAVHKHWSRAACNFWSSSPIGTVSHTEEYTYEFRAPSHQPDADGWIVNTGTMPYLHEYVDVRYTDGSEDVMWSPSALEWGKQDEDEHITHWKPTKLQPVKATKTGIEQIDGAWRYKSGLYPSEHEAARDVLMREHGISVHPFYQMPNRNDEHAMALFKRLLELRGAK